MHPSCRGAGQALWLSVNLQESDQDFTLWFCVLPAGNYLFFGCRGAEKDFYCRREWESLEQKKLLTLFTAFSRDQVSLAVWVVGCNNNRSYSRYNPIKYFMIIQTNKKRNTCMSYHEYNK